MSIKINRYSYEYYNLWDNFVLNDSINGTIYHTRKFLSYHNDKFIDSSILIYWNDKIVGVLPACIYNHKYYSHKGSTCGGLVYSKQVNNLDKLTKILDNIFLHFNNYILIKVSENIYFKDNSNDLLNFILSQKCDKLTDISMYYELNVNSPIDLFPKNDNKRLLCKHIKNKIINIRIADTIEEYSTYYDLLLENLKEKNDVSPLHSKEEFLNLKEILGTDQFLIYTENENKEMLSGAYVLKINKNCYYTVYLMTNYKKKNSQIFYVIYELLEYAKINNIKFVNLGACSINGGDLLETKYKFKESIGTKPVLKYTFIYQKTI